MKKLTLGFILLFITSLTYAEIFLNASQAEYFPEYDRFNDELYFMPIKISVKTDAANGTLKIYCAPERDEKFTLIKQSDETNLDFFYGSEDENEFVPRQKYYFKAELYSTNGNLLESSSVQEGWPCLSPALFFVEYDKAVKLSHSRLNLINKESNFDKLGKEEIIGMISGTLGYKTSVKLQSLSGVVSMPYKSYSDDGIFILHGSMNTKANMQGNGTMNGKVVISGMYTGFVNYDNIQIKNSKAGGGFYIVKPEGFEESKIDYTLTFYGEEK